jgi:hypothetical protein
MRALFLTDAEMKVLMLILRAAVVQGSSSWMKKSIAGPEYNYTHGKIIELCRRSMKGECDDFVIERQQKLTIRRERMAAIKLAKKALNV